MGAALDFSLAVLKDTDMKARIEKLCQLLDQASGVRGQEAKRMANDAKSKLAKRVVSEYGALAYHHCKANKLRGKEGERTLRAAWRDLVLEGADVPKRQLGQHGLLPWVTSTFLTVRPDFGLLPVGSFCLCLPITLAKPYFSRGEQPFYITDNPLLKDPVVGLPLVAPSTWKGCLRSALRQAKHCGDDNEMMRRLLGAPHEEADGTSGRLFFYPSFFMRIGLEVMNPHERTRRIGTTPLQFECAPPGSGTTFNLLYAPLDLMGHPATDIASQVAEDLEWTAEGVRAMLVDYGFGAKTYSGLGLAKEHLASEGRLVFKCAGLLGGTPGIGAEPLYTVLHTLPDMLNAAKSLAQCLKGETDEESRGDTD